MHKTSKWIAISGDDVEPEKESYNSKKFLLDGNLAIKYHYWTRMRYRDILEWKMTFDAIGTHKKKP